MMVSKRFIAVYCWLALACTSAFAQNGSKAYSLEECIQIALGNNSAFKNAANRVDLAGANVTASYSNILPQITSSFQSGRNIRGETRDAREIAETVAVNATDAVSGDPVIIGATRLDVSGSPIINRQSFTSPTLSFWGHSMTLRYSQTLFDFGRSWNLIGQSKASFNAASEGLAAARLNVHSLVTQRYMELLKAQRLEQEYAQAVERSKAELDRTKSMFEIGSVAQIDVYRQEVTLGTDEINYINQQNIVKIARGNLNVAMGKEPDEPLNIMTMEPISYSPDFTLEDAYALAEKSNPELRQFEYDMESAQRGRKAAKGRLLPSIGIGATYTRDNEELSRVYGTIGQNYFLTFGASVSFNIFNGFNDIANISRETANYSIANENWVAQRRQLRLQVKQAFLNLEGYNRITEINETRLRSSEEEYRLAQERYRVGAGTQLEVTEAQVSLTRARVQLVTAQYDAMIAKAQLETAIGTIEKD